MRNHTEQLGIQDTKEASTHQEQFFLDETVDDLSATHASVLTSMTEQETGALTTEVLHTPIKKVNIQMKDPTESLPAGIILGDKKDIDQNIIEIAFIDTQNNNAVVGASTLSTALLRQDIINARGPISKEFTLADQLYRCTYTISGEELTVSIDLIGSEEQLSVFLNSLPREIPGGPDAPQARSKSTKRGMRRYQEGVLPYVVFTDKIGKSHRAEGEDLGLTKRDLNALAHGPVEKTGAITFTASGETKRYTINYLLQHGEIVATIKELSEEIDPKTVSLTHVSQTLDGIDMQQVDIEIDQHAQKLLIRHREGIGTEIIDVIDLNKYPGRRSFGKITEIDPLTSPKISKNGKMFRLGVTLERKTDGSLIMWTREIPVTNKTIVFKDKNNTTQEAPMGTRMWQVTSTPDGKQRQLADTGRQGSTLLTRAVANSDFDHTPGTTRQISDKPLFIKGKAYNAVLCVNEHNVHELQLQILEGAEQYVSSIDPVVHQGGGDLFAGSRSMSTIGGENIHTQLADHPDTKTGIQNFFSKDNNTITVQYRDKNKQVTTTKTLVYSSEQIYLDLIRNRKEVAIQATDTIDGKPTDLLFRLSIDRQGNMRMFVDNITKKPPIEMPEIVQKPEDNFKNFMNGDLLYANETIRLKGFFSQLAGPKNMSPAQESKFNILYPGQPSLAGKTYDNSKIHIFRNDEFNPLNIENPLELGDNDSLMTVDLDAIPAEKWEKMRPELHPDGTRSAGAGYTFNNNVKDVGLLGLRPPRYNNETWPTTISLEPVRGTPVPTKIDTKGDEIDPRDDVIVAKRPILGYAVRLKVDIPKQSDFRLDDREIDREYVQQKAKEAGQTVLEFLEGLVLATGAFLGPVWEKIKEKFNEWIERTSDIDVEKKQKFIEMKELQDLDMTRPLPGYKYQRQSSAEHQGYKEFMSSTDFGWRWVNEPQYKDKIDFHPALDIGGLNGKHPPVLSALAGTVIAVGSESMSVLHDEKITIGGNKKYRLQTTYIHIKPDTNLLNKKIAQGSSIGAVADDHLHFEVQLIDPSTNKPVKFTYPGPVKTPEKYASLPLDDKDNPTNCINPAWFFDPNESGAEHDFYGKLPKGYEVSQTAPSETAKEIMENADLFMNEMSPWIDKQSANHKKAFEIMQTMHLHGETIAITGVESNWGNPNRLVGKGNVRGPFGVIAGDSKYGFYTDFTQANRPYNKELIEKHVDKTPFSKLKNVEDGVYKALNTGTMIGMSAVYAKVFDMVVNKPAKLPDSSYTFDGLRGKFVEYTTSVQKRLKEQVGIEIFDETHFKDFAENIRTDPEAFERRKVRCAYSTEEHIDGYKDPYRATHALTTMYVAKLLEEGLIESDDDDSGGDNGGTTDEEAKLEEEANKNKVKIPETLTDQELNGLTMDEYTLGMKATEKTKIKSSTYKTGTGYITYYQPKVFKVKSGESPSIVGAKKIYYKDSTDATKKGFYFLQTTAPYSTRLYFNKEVKIGDNTIKQDITTEDIGNKEVQVINFRIDNGD